MILPRSTGRLVVSCKMLTQQNVRFTSFDLVFCSITWCSSCRCGSNDLSAAVLGERQMKSYQSEPDTSVRDKPVAAASLADASGYEGKFLSAARLKTPSGAKVFSDDMNSSRLGRYRDWDPAYLVRGDRACRSSVRRATRGSSAQILGEYRPWRRGAF